MGLFNKVKGLISKNDKQIKSGIDKAADVVQKKAPDKYDDKIDKAADTLKGAVDKVD